MIEETIRDDYYKIGQIESPPRPSVAPPAKAVVSRTDTTSLPHGPQMGNLFATIVVTQVISVKI